MKPIWIVDDDHSIRFVLEKALAREQFAVRSFANAREVLSALDDEEPQVMISDIRMPGGSGIDLLGKVKARLPGLPVIIMTAYSDLDSAVSAFQGGAFEYLPKPFDVPKAVELIRRAVEESLREDVRELLRGVLDVERNVLTVKAELALLTGDLEGSREALTNALRFAPGLFGARHRLAEVSRFLHADEAFQVVGESREVVAVEGDSTRVAGF